MFVTYPLNFGLFWLCASILTSLGKAKKRFMASKVSSRSPSSTPWLTA